MKNFAILYEDVTGPYQLSPIYDVVCTKPYGDEKTALSINDSRNYPHRSYLEKLGKTFGVREPKSIIDRVSDAVDKISTDYADIMHQLKAQNILEAIIQNRGNMLAGKY